MDGVWTRPRDMGRRDFDKFRRLIHGTCGIALGETKDALLTARVAKRMRQLGIDSHGAYFDLVVGDETGSELQCLVDAVSTNVTSFFREPEHLVMLGEHLVRLGEQGRESVTMWSAACSTGEEPYSMAMVAADRAPFAKVRILATDISTKALAVAREGRYSPERAAKLPAECAAAHLGPERDGMRQVSAAMRSLVTFSAINLARPPFPMRGPFDVVFCRNVMIYFDTDTRRRLVSEIDRLLAPGGLLMLGHAESLAGLDSPLKAIAPAVYEKVAR